MSGAWTDIRPGGAFFGYMHEDPAPECSLVSSDSEVLCVLSAGDMAFSFLRADASRVYAVDPNLAQFELVYRKLARAGEGMNVQEAVASNLVCEGLIDRRLQFLAKWIAPLVMGRRGAKAFSAASLRWRSAWRLLHLGIICTFSKAYRAHFPADIVLRLRRRMETALESSSASPWLNRMMATQASDVPDAWESTWPDCAFAAEPRLSMAQTTLQNASVVRPVNLIAASNVLDTEPASMLPDFLNALSPLVETDGVIVLRSLFRESNEWPAPPQGWAMDRSLLAQLIAMDSSPLCQVTGVWRKVEAVC